MDREQLKKILLEMSSGYQGRTMGVDGAIDAIIKLCNACPLKSVKSTEFMKSKEYEITK